MITLPFLRVGLLAVLLATMAAAVNAQTNKYTVIVIGSGISGLGCARTLVDGGVGDVLLLEARDRKGGRLFTSNVGGYPIDLGGAWIHGPDGNPLTALAKKYKLGTVVGGDDSTTFSESGKILSDAVVNNAQKQYNAFLTYLEKLRRGKTLNISSSVEDVWQSWPARKNFSVELTQQVRQALNSAIEQEYAGPLRLMSALYYDQDSEFDGDDLLWTKGYSSLIEALAAGLNIQYNQVVASVDYSSSPVKVTTADGTVYTANYVVSTLPLGVLQSSSAPKFTPAFTGAKANAIAKLGVGLLNKVILVFPSAFWAEEADTEWIERVTAVVGDFCEYFTLNRALRIPVIVGFTSADFAWAQEGRTDAQIMADVTAKLKAMFPDTYQAPTAYKITRWGQDRFSLGSYSYIKAGAPENAYSSLAAPLNNRLFFAGEATNQEFPSAAHGAYSSGVREGKRILGLVSKAVKRGL